MKKRIGIVAAVLLTAGLAFGQAAYTPRVYTVGTTNFMILPAVNPELGTNTWAAGVAYTRGQYLQIFTNGPTLKYWCITAGTTTNSPPTWSSTNDVPDGPTLVWRPINPVRNAITVINTGSVNASLAYGNKIPISGSGMTIYSGGGGWNYGYGRLPPWQGEVRAIAASATTTLAVHEE